MTKNSKHGGRLDTSLDVEARHGWDDDVSSAAFIQERQW